MKKVIAIIVFGLLLSGCASQAPNKKTVELMIDDKIKIGMGADEFYNLIPDLPPMDFSLFFRDETRFFENYAFVGWYDYNAWDGGKGLSKIFIFEKKDKKKTKHLVLKNGTTLKFTSKNKLVAIKNDFRSATEYLLDKEPTAHIFLDAIETSEAKFKIVYGSGGTSTLPREKLKKEKEKKDLAATQISFTIKDKKEQCTAIGFAPATEKFADCVLRLVELDVKSQQATQIALAQSQGNQMVADQLKEQNNSRSSDAFINLGTQLLNPQSNVSAPSTSTCRVIGSGAYKTVNCW
tara:strand:+ start:5630 stop:6508 length:879 start_codon:yes stop_codon:yes gene_type:complete